MSNNERDVRFMHTCIGTGIGILVGLCIGAVLRGNKSDVLEQFPREGNVPAIIRNHRYLARDFIYVAPSVGSYAPTNQFISLEAYLDKIGDPYDRTIEEAKIKRRVNW